MSKVEKGTVYLIGAGPAGDPGLITIKGNEILQKCDTVIFDQLVPIELIFSLKNNIEKHYVGKKAGRHTLTQDAINKLMVKLAKQGKSVARLKGGDPFLFGRGAEEAKFLLKNNIKFEVIPGITAGLGATAYGGISCTDRNKSSFVVFATGHKAKKKSITVPWHQLAKLQDGTIVIYMVVSKMDDIIQELIKNGMPKNIPAAMIERGTFSSQKIVTSTLSNLVLDAKSKNIKPPSILIVGKVVEDQKKLYWLKNRPLLGVKILINEHKDYITSLYNELSDLGAEVLPYPSYIKTSHKENKIWEILNSHLAGKESKNGWLIFQHSDQVTFFIARYINLYKDTRSLHKFNIVALGQETKNALIQHHLYPDLTEKENNLEKALEKISSYYSPALIGESNHERKIDIFISAYKSEKEQQNSIDVENKFTGIFNIHFLPVLKNIFFQWPEGLKEKLFEQLPDIIIFPNEETTRFFSQNLSQEEAILLTKEAKIIGFHEETIKNLKSQGISGVKRINKSNLIKEIINIKKQV